TGTATDMVPRGGWTTAATRLFERGLRAIESKVPKILYGTAGIGIPYPDHGRGNHAHIEWGTEPIKGIGRGGLAPAKHIARMLVKGTPGPIRDLIQHAMDRAQ